MWLLWLQADCEVLEDFAGGGIDDLNAGGYVLMCIEATELPWRAGMRIFFGEDGDGICCCWVKI